MPKSNRNQPEEKSNYIKYIILLFLGGFSLHLGAYVFCLFLVFLVWLIPSQNKQLFMERILDFKKYKVRAWVSASLVLLSLIFLIQSLWGTYQDRKHEEYLKTVPSPEIIILSSLEPQKGNNEYELLFNLKNANRVSLDGKFLVPNKEGGYSEMISLLHPKNKLLLNAENDHKSTKKEIIISREETEQERKSRLEEVKKAKFARESKDGDIAVVCAQQEVKSLLKSPSSADFPMNIGMSSSALGENKYVVKSYVDSQNSFGATIRTNFFCTAEVIDRRNFICKTECLFQ